MKLFKFFKEARSELKKVTWPTRDEVTKYTAVTFVTLFVISVFLWVVDTALMHVINLVIR